MKKVSKNLLIALVLTSSILLTIPTITVLAEEEEDVPVFTVGACGPRDIYHWSMEAYVASSGDYYLYNTLENLYIWPLEADKGNIDNLEPVLATSWTVHNRPSEMTASGFMAYDGIAYMDITLRENVKFHDGSDWNATVCKWNIDRLFYILGDINDCLPDLYDPNVRNTRYIYWMSTTEWAPYATSSWNVADLTPGLYAEYGLSADPSYNGLLSSRFPRVQKVTILDDKQSGGEVRVYFNDWSTGPQYLANFEFISIAAYKDYFDTPILGYGDNPSFPQDDPSIFPGHLIGTGPYIFEGHDFISGTGSMTRNDDWWNAATLQAQGWFNVPEVRLEQFSHSSAGYNARTTALTTGDIDYATDRVWEPLDYSTVAAISGVNYVDMGVEAYGETIVLNCIDETYLKYWSDIELDVSTLKIPAGLGNSVDASGYYAKTIDANGVNRAFRKALSYAYDYNTYLNTGKAGRAVRSGGLLGTKHEYYDASIPLAYYNLAIARSTLLEDPFWGPICANRGLTALSSDADWKAVANGANPIYTFEYHYDEAHIPSYNTLVSSLENIGCDIDETKDEPTTYTVITQYTFPLFSVDGFAISPYHARLNDLGYIQAYLGSSYISQHAPFSDPSYGVISDYYFSSPYITDPYNYALIPYTTYPYAGYSNMGFNFNTTCNSIISRLWFQNDTGKESLYHELARWCQDYQFPAIYLSNEKTGYAINNEFTAQWHSNFFTFSYAYVKYVGPQPEIPGYETGIILIVGFLSLAGVAYVILRKRKVMIK